MSRPSKTMRPAVGSRRRMMQRAIVDLPQPDSPTTPSVSPCRTENETPSTAFTAAICFWKMIPRVTAKCFFRSSTTRSSSPRTSPPVATSAVRVDAKLAGLRQGAGQDLRRLAVLRLDVEVAGLEVVALAARRHEVRLDPLAAAHHVRAARVEPAAAGRVQERRRLPLDMDEPLDVSVEPRQRAEKAPRVRVMGAAEEDLGRCLLVD